MEIRPVLDSSEGSCGNRSEIGLILRSRHRISSTQPSAPFSASDSSTACSGSKPTTPRPETIGAGRQPHRRPAALARFKPQRPVQAPTTAPSRPPPPRCSRSRGNPSGQCTARPAPGSSQRPARFSPPNRPQPAPLVSSKSTLLHSKLTKGSRQVPRIPSGSPACGAGPAKRVSPKSRG